MTDPRALTDKELHEVAMGGAMIHSGMSLVLRDIKKSLIKLLYVLVTVYFSIAFYGYIRGGADKDDTDPAGGRSGMVLYTDDKTGCQYLSNRFGGMTPRLNRDGEQICPR